MKLAPAGVTVQELIDDHCGGMAGGTHLQGLPAGRRLGRHPARVAWPTSPSISAPWSSMAAFIGSAAVVILSDQDDIKDVALNLMRFFEDESCGQCTPCRNGTEKAVQHDECRR